MSKKKSIYKNKSSAAIRRLIGFLKSKGFNYQAQPFSILQTEFERLTGLIKPNKITFREWMCQLYNTESTFLPKGKGKKKVPKVKKKRKDREAYQRYLKSSAWETFRQKAFDFYGRECKKCGCKNNLHVHHKTYKNLFN